jgi:large subunit ribosomal protein L9
MGQVKLILREDVPSLGDAGELVSVKPGYARNYLIPQGKAGFATEANVKELEHQRRVVEAKLAKELASLTAVRKHVEGLTLEVKARAGEEGKLFGSVTSLQIAELLAENGIEVDRRRVQLSEPIKELGEHSVGVKLHRDLVAQIVVTVSAEQAPAAPPRERDADEDRHEADRRDEADDDDEE